MLKYIKKYWIYCLLAPLFMLGELAMDLLQPAMMATIVDDGVLSSNMQIIISMGIRMVLLVAFGGTSGVLCGIFANIAAQRFGNAVRKDLFAKIMDFSYEQTDHFTTGSLVTRITNDVTQVEQMVMMTVRSFVRCSVLFVGGIYMLWLQSPQFAVISACGLPILAIIVILFLKTVSPLYTVIQKKLDNLNCIMQETIAGARVVKAYVREKFALKKFSVANDELCGANLKAQTILAFLNPSVNLILNLCVVGVLYVSGIDIQGSGSITPGQTIAAITYLSLILMRIIFMANIFQTFTRATASWKRISEVLNTTAVHRNGNSSPPTEMIGEISFCDVSFYYPEAPENTVLMDISLDIHHGETIAIIGATGSGKSSLANLIPRFYDTTSGRILVDGLDVRDYSLSELREKIGFVQQQAELFSRSIKENIGWGKASAADAEIQHAAQVAQSADFIERMKDGYDSFVTEGGPFAFRGTKTASFDSPDSSQEPGNHDF